MYVPLYLEVPPPRYPPTSPLRLYFQTRTTKKQFSSLTAIDTFSIVGISLSLLGL